MTNLSEEATVVLDFQQLNFNIEDLSRWPSHPTISDDYMLWTLTGRGDTYLFRAILEPSGSLQDVIILADDSDDPEDPLREIEPLCFHYLVSSKSNAFLLVYFELKDYTPNKEVREVDILIQEVQEHRERQTLLQETWAIPAKYGIDPSWVADNDNFVLFVIEKNVFLFDQNNCCLEMIFEADSDGFRDFFNPYFYQNKAYFACYFTRGPQQGVSLYCYDINQKSLQRVFITQDWIPLRMIETADHWLFLCTTDADRYQVDSTSGLMMVEMPKEDKEAFKITSVIERPTIRLGCGVRNVESSYDANKETFVFSGVAYIQSPEHLQYFIQTHQMLLPDKIAQVPAACYPLDLYLIGTYALNGKKQLYFLADFIRFHEKAAQECNNETEPDHCSHFLSITWRLYHEGCLYFTASEGIGKQLLVRHKIRGWEL